MPRPSNEFQKFDAAMDTILKADPKAVKDAMDAEKQERQQTGKKRGPRPKAKTEGSPR